jgi:hypothetical protein
MAGENLDASMPAPVSAAIDAANRHDATGFLDLFRGDGVVDDWGREFRGRDEISGWNDREFIGVEVSLVISEVIEVDGETVVNAMVGGRGFNGMSHFGFRTDGERISRMTIRA